MLKGFHTADTVAITVDGQKNKVKLMLMLHYVCWMCENYC